MLGKLLALIINYNEEGEETWVVVAHAAGHRQVTVYVPDDKEGSFLHLRTVWRKLTMQPSTQDSPSLPPEPVLWERALVPGSLLCIGRWLLLPS